ncbi:MAG: glycosyltransferase family 1 protein, partial [Selenomonadaceae bacterium]|nr:glycosyltransferase family 1 protein [Selenomonadaceae bacterium]
AFCDCTDTECVNACFDLMRARQVAFCAGLNNFGMIWQVGEREVIHTYDEYDVPHVSIMLDTPYNKTVSGFDEHCPKHIVTLLDKTAEEYVRLAYPDKAGKAIFLPLAGMESDNTEDVFARERCYDVVVSASTWGAGGTERQWHGNGVSSRVAKILDDAADYLEVNAEGVFAALKYVLQARGLQGDEYLRRMLPYCWDLLLYIKSYRRLKAVELLARNDIPVDVFGNGWDIVPFAGKLKLHGPVSYEQSLEIASQAKIIFQDQAEFNHGAHDRVFTGMLNGAVVVSEFSHYLAEEFEAGRDLFMFDWQNGDKQVQVIHELLADESKRLSVAVSAYGKAVRRHRWANRAERILEAVDVLYGVEV